MAKVKLSKKEAEKQKAKKREVVSNLTQKNKNRGKKYREASLKVEKDKLYTPEEATELVRGLSTSKFVGTVESHIKLGVNTTKPEQMVRGVVNLPHGTGKEVRVIFFSEDEALQVEAKKAGAIEVGSDDLVEKIEKGFLDFDTAVATPGFMKSLAKIARVLGPRGLMPSPKSGTITDDPKKTIGEIRKGQVSFRVDKTGVVHAPIGKVSFDQTQLLENLQEFVKTVKNLRPAGQKGKYVMSLYLSPTMGPGVKVNPSSLISL